MRALFISAIPLDACRTRVVITDDQDNPTALAEFTCHPEDVPALIDAHLVSVQNMDSPVPLEAA